MKKSNSKGKEFDCSFMILEFNIVFFSLEQFISMSLLCFIIITINFSH